MLSSIKIINQTDGMIIKVSEVGFSRKFNNKQVKTQREKIL